MYRKRQGSDILHFESTESNVQYKIYFENNITIFLMCAKRVRNCQCMSCMTVISHTLFFSRSCIRTVVYKLSAPSRRNWNWEPHLYEEPVALSIHLTSHCESLSKHSKHSASNINIWSQSSSCPTKYSQGEEKVAQSQASCCVYYFSVWPLTYRQRKDSCVESSRALFWWLSMRQRKKESKIKMVGGRGLNVVNLDPQQVLSVLDLCTNLLLYTRRKSELWLLCVYRLCGYRGMQSV